MKAQTERHIRILGRILFLAYLASLVYLLFFAERGSTPYGYRANLVPFREIRRILENRDILGTRYVLLNIGGNILLFVPFGAILPVVHRYFGRPGRTILSGALLSAGVEGAQYITMRGRCDIDDVLLNTFGCAAGYLLFACIRRLRRRSA